MNNRRDPLPSLPQGSDAAFDSSEPQFLVVGRILRPHGVRGELRVEVHTAYPERFALYRTLYIGPTLVPYRIKKHRFHKNLVLLTLDGIDDRTQAEALRGQWLQIALEDAIPLQKGEYYTYQVIGMQVTTDDGQELGHVIEMMETGANDVYIVQGPRGEILLPDIPTVILKVDVPGRQMTVHLLDGLVE